MTILQSGLLVTNFFSTRATESYEINYIGHLYYFRGTKATQIYVGNIGRRHNLKA